jgi:parallel beta-helix repeat protein
MKVHGESFETSVSSMAVEVGYSSECEIWNLDTTGNYIGIGVLMSSNLTIHNIDHDGGPRSSAIAVFSSDNVTIRNGEFSYCRDIPGAIWGMNVDNFNVTNNQFDRNTGGINIQTGIDVYIMNNDFLNTEESAIYVSSGSSEHIHVENNDILNATYGIYSSNADNWTIFYNTIMYCSVYGIYLSGDSADDVNITSNFIENNNNGIRVSLGDNALIRLNSIMWNSGTGIYLDMSSGTEIYYNTFVMNLQNNGHDTHSNTWDDTFDTGNFWNDYTPPGVYDIPGSGTAVDNYPMNFNVTEPIISQPQDIYYAEGSESNEILWLALDNSLKNWIVSINGEEWASAAWNFHNITVNIDGLQYGTHTVDITLWDVDLNNVTDTVIVHVFDDTPPEISNTPNGEAFSTATGQILSWDVSDLHPDTYTVYLDGEEWTTGTWTTGVLEISIDGMTPGEHSLVMEIRDIDGNPASDTVLLMIYEDLDNPIVDSPDDITYTLGDTGNVIIWESQDDHPASFQVAYGGSVFTEGDWAGSRVTVNVDGLNNGTHTFTLMVFDGTGNSATDAVRVTVLLPTPDATPPPPPLDLGIIGLVVAVIGGVAVIVVVVIIALKKKRTPY